MKRILKTVVIFACGAGFSAALLLPWSREHNPDLDQGWHVFMEGLEQAQASLTDPKHFPAPPSDRNLAEGHRYLLAHVNRLIEMGFRQNARFPEFNRSMDMLRKWTGENPDTMYLKAPIDGEGYYRVEGSTPAGAAPPRLLSFAAITSVPGGTGNLLEMADCTNQTLDSIAGSDLQLDSEGSFSILLGPTKPDDYLGAFLQTRKAMTCGDSTETSDRRARYLSVREVFSDWSSELPLDIKITRLDAIGENRPPLTSVAVAKIMTQIGEELPKQIRFWQQVQALALEVYGDVNLDGKRSMPVNSTNQPAPPFTAGGVAGAGQLYAGGSFEISNTQALIIKVTAPVEPRYVGFQLNNLWFEGADQQNYVSSLSGDQLPVSSDRSRYYVVAHSDPGIQGWVDTTGLEKGTHVLRFFFDEDLPPEGVPKVETVLVDLSQVSSHLPEDTPTVSKQERRREVAVRQSHIKRRWRGY
jgi:hypothetical protein